MKVSSLAIAAAAPIVVTRVFYPANKGFEFPQNNPVYKPSHGRPSDHHSKNNDEHVDTDTISLSNSDAWSVGDLQSGIEMEHGSALSGLKESILPGGSSSIDDGGVPLAIDVPEGTA